MRRGVIIFLLAFGAVAGFTLGFARLHYGHRWHDGHAFHHGRWGHERAAFENHVADVCTRAAERVFTERGKAAPAPPQ